MKKHVQELHNQYDKFGKIIRLQLVHKYDTKQKTWEFHGYRCSYCDTVLMYPSTIQKHPNTCRVLNKTNTRTYGADSPELVITTDRKVWEPKYVKPE